VSMRPMPFMVVLACLAVLAGCGTGEDENAGAFQADTTRPADPHQVETEHGAHPDAPGGQERSPEQDHSGAYNLIEDARSTADEANERIHEMESTLGDL